MRRTNPAIEVIFSERKMLALSVLAILAAVIELSATLDDSQMHVIEAVDWWIVSVYTAEYFAKLYSASPRSAYAKDAWNLLNLTIIALPFVGLFTSTSLVLYAPILRTLRLGRIIRTSSATLDGAKVAHETL